jgi:RNA polymerase sigma-70 factor (ECF subfamily)
LGCSSRRPDALAIRACLDAIDGPQRQCLALGYYHGMSHSEIAATSVRRSAA